MPQTKKESKATIWIIIAIVLSISTAIILLLNGTEESEYQPIEEFAPAYNALSSHENSEEYDIEETIRILNGLELAQSSSEDFYSYLEYMAKQDYSLVASDVIEAKIKLLPILQELFLLEQQSEKLANIWTLVRGMGNAIETIGESEITLPLNALEQVATGALEQYKEESELKGTILKKIEKLKMDYFEYLYEFSPIYYKYMNEWDKLCILKDKAYLSLSAGNNIDAYNRAMDVLKLHPNNREALLLKALSLIRIASDSQVCDSIDIQIEKQNSNHFLIEANNTIDAYIEMYPNRSAPAFVLKAQIDFCQNKPSSALTHLDQAAIEYPRQAEALLDILDSYRVRSYLNKSHEGQYLLRLYNSTMEGYGNFSPNFIKASYYEQTGNIEKSKEEIFKHFFRRGNQGVYDCLLSDMQYCEQHLSNGFNQLLIEHSFLDLVVYQPQNSLFKKNDDKLGVIINNRSDIDIENVRIFLCIHKNDMYPDDYEVIKLPTKNIIYHHSSEVIEDKELKYDYNTITRVRAIAMTDDKICWIDDVDYKRQQASSSLSKKEAHSPISLDTIKEAIENNIVGSYTNNKEGKLLNKIASFFSDNEANAPLIEIELPRILTMIDPVFSLNQMSDSEKVIFPEECFLAGSNIRLRFQYELSENENIPLYIYSKFCNLKINISRSDGKFNLGKIELI